MCHDFCLPQSSWITLLSIAHRYEFVNIYKHAIHELYDLPIERGSDPGFAMLVSVVEKYDVPLRHVVMCIGALVVRPESLKEAEVVHLSTLTICRLGPAREEYLRRTGRRSIDSRAAVALKIVHDIWGRPNNDS